MKSILSLLFFAAAAATLIWWFVNGHHAWTSTQSLVSVTTKDEIFGTTTTSQQWVDQFTPGFLPFSDMSASGSSTGLTKAWHGLIGFLGTGILAFIFLVDAVWMIMLARKSRKNAATV